jgi:hypothetical protein
MFLRHARATRLAAAYLIFTVALLMVPKADILETLFDEANTPTNEMVVGRPASSLENPHSITAVTLRIFAKAQKISVGRILSLNARRLTDSRMFRELFCFLLC